MTEGIISIDESGADGYSYSNASGAKMEYVSADMAAVGTSVHAAQIAVKADVKISFEIR